MMRDSAKKAGWSGVSDPKAANVGYCITDFANLVSNNFNNEVPKRVSWTFDPILLADVDHIPGGLAEVQFPVSDPQAWKIRETDDPMYDQIDRRNVKEHEVTLRIAETRGELPNKAEVAAARREGEVQMKADLLDLQFKQVSAKIECGELPAHVDFYFIDDGGDDTHFILEGLVEKVEKRELMAPANIRFHVVRYDWYGIIQEGDTVSEYDFVKRDWVEFQMQNNAVLDDVD